VSRVAIVGAGIGGLTAALELAGAGCEVDVYEAGPRVGGKAGVAEHDGVTFDTGPSVVTLPHVFDAPLRAVGSSLGSAVDLLRPDPATRYHFPDGAVLDVRADAADARREVAQALGEAAAAEWDAFLRYAGDIWASAAPWFVEGDAPTPGHLLRILPAAIGHLPRIDPLRTMNRALEGRVTDERLRWLFQRFATYNGSDPRRAPATLHCIAHVEITAGVFGVRGGLHALPEALAAAARSAGVRVHLDTPVRGVHVQRGRVTGLTLATGGGAEEITADAVVCNADVAHLTGDLLPAATRTSLPRHPVPSMSGWTGVVRARRRPAADRPAHAVLFPSRYAAEFEDIFDAGRAPAEPTVYLCAQEKAHARSGWAEHEPLFVMANAPPLPEGPAPSEAGPHPLRDVVLRRLREAGLIDPDDALVWERSPVGLARQFPGTRGAIYGAASNDPFAAFRRPPNRAGRPVGLYLASGSAHPGGGVPLCGLSGRAAARALLADLGG
jgi:1-hydroxycarotenoid 3,4-desaturase